MNVSQILSRVNKPGRFVGREYNSVGPSTGREDLLAALIFPDLYEVGMSHQGLQILYHILNREPGIRAERCFCPDPDTEALLRSEGGTLTTLESGHSLTSCDFLGITLPHELCYTNILTILACAGLNFAAADRGEEDPLLIGGGACAGNPEPVADFFDAILVGDGEEAIIEIARTLAEAKRARLNKEQKRLRLSAIDGIYIPSWYRPRCDSAGHLIHLDSSPEANRTVRRRVLADLDRIDHLSHPLVPNARIIHDRLGIEVARGCTRGCRFCQAGMTYRPVRERSVQQIMTLAGDGISHSGFEELALLSLSTGDYSCLSELLPSLMRRYRQDYVSVALPSMRVGTLTEAVMNEIKKVRKTGFTLAPEAGSERLRQAINKGITEQDLLDTVRNAFDLGWKLIKLYFMIGLPTETEQDLDAIVELARKVAAEGAVSGRGRKRVNLSVGTFVPKPHTPYQWEPQLDLQESRKRLELLRQRLPRQGFRFRWHDPEQSFLEGVFARGDRRLGALTVEAWKRGARLDSWSDHFKLDLWLQAAESCGLELESYLRRRDPEKPLPWEHLDHGLSREFLLRELEYTRDGTYTPDCRYHGCQQCGVCDFSTIKPVVQNTSAEAAPTAVQPEPAPTGPEVGTTCTYLVSYSRIGEICYLGHLEFLQMIFRGLRRAGIRTTFSRGYNPSPKVSFGPALPVGTESLCEFFLMELAEPLTDLEHRARSLSRALPEGIEISSIAAHGRKLPQEILCTYEIILATRPPADTRSRLERFLEQKNWIVSRLRQGQTRQLDIRPLIPAISLSADDTIGVDLVSRSGVPGVKPLEALASILELDPASLQGSRVRKLQWKMG